MLMQQEDRDTTAAGVLETASFKIKANGKAFKILLDRLYPDKIKAVVRELWTNAYDAHIAAGNADTPFECTLPNTFDPHLAVRDFGIGMTHEDIMGLYATVFESTKDKSNDQVGQLGLGSKSPFAYSDTFTVTAWSGTERRVYTAFVDSAFMPQISLMLVEADNAPRGIEVSIPVRREDFYAFKDRARNLIPGFDTRPTIKGVDFKEANNKVLLSGTGWRMYGKQGQAYARQGCVLYPIDSSSVSDYSSMARSVAGMNVVVDFPVGQLDITANREALSYDATTKANVNKRLDEVAEEVLSSYKAAIKGCTTQIAAHTLLTELMETLPHNSYTLRDVLLDVRWRGKKVQYGNQQFRFDGRICSQVRVNTYGNQWFMNRRRRSNYLNHNYASFTPGNVLFVLVDPEDGLKRIEERIQVLYASDSANRGYSIIAIHGRPGTLAFGRVMITLGRPELINLKDYAPPTRPKGKGPDSTTMAKLIDGLCPQPIKLDFEEGGYYVPQDRLVFGDHHDKYGIATLISNAKAAGILPKKADVYAVPKSLSNKLKLGEWENAIDLIDAALAPESDTYKYFARVDMLEDIGDHLPSYLAQFKVFLKDHAKLVGGLKGTALAETAKLLIALDSMVTRAETATVANYRALLNARAHRSLVPASNADVLAQIPAHAAALDAYPMLKILLGRCVNLNDVEQRSVAAYVRKIDRAHAKVQSSDNVSLETAA